MDELFSALNSRHALVEHARYFKQRYIAAGCVLAFIIIFAAALFLAPVGFPTGKIIVIPAGTSLNGTASILKENHAITSAHLFTLYARLRGWAGSIHAGAYRFDTPLGLTAVAARIESGVTGVPEAVVTIPEGFTARDMAAAYGAALPEVTMTDFLSEAAGHEGYLFPDTYSFLPDATSSVIVSMMLQNFDSRTASITPAIAASGHSLHDIVTMASLIEKEAKTPVDRRMVSGILWNRIKAGMPLQVDAVFGYISGTATHTPSAAELESDSPYNTYMHAGLPPGPIDNPGLDSILAALYPSKTPDLYYLTGKNGTMYYAKTLAAHDANIQKYL